MKHNRWLVVLGALLIQVSLGAIYIYSIFKPALKAHFPGWSATDLALPAQILLAAEALSMIAAGRFQDKFGPKKISIAGGLLLLLGMYIAAKAHTLFQFVLGFGISGCGIGAAYVCPIATCVKWFPDKRGLITGLAVAGFGAGGLVFAPLAGYFISTIGVMATLFYLGLIYFLAIIIGAQLMRLPRADYCPPGWNPPLRQASLGIIKTDYAAKEMIKTRQFWILWLTYFIGCVAGLLVIMNLVTIWQAQALAGAANAADIVSSFSFARILTQGALVVMIVSILNSLGRIIWGRISDKYGREKTLMTIFAFCGAALLILGSLNSFWSFAGVASIIGFCFGGFLALYPAITADYFGSKNIGANYGLMFTAYGAGGLLGPWLAPKLLSAVRDIPYETADTAGKTIVKLVEAGSYANSFILAGILCLIAGFLVLKLRHQ
ncbi:MAG: OFA family MFS transporter [Minisyncoccales bacterium]